MTQQRFDVCETVSCEGKSSRDWYAWNNRMPPKPDDFHVVGEVLVPNTGIKASLYPKEPQGINPSILQLNLVLCQRPGMFLHVMTWVPARYDKVLPPGHPGYRQVSIFCGDTPVATIDVQDVH